MKGASLGYHSLSFGAFYGRPEVRHSTSGIDISVLNADPHRVVERHTHADAHFVLVLDGLYASSAAGAEPVTNGRALIFLRPARRIATGSRRGRESLKDDF